MKARDRLRYYQQLKMTLTLKSINWLVPHAIVVVTVLLRLFTHSLWRQAIIYFNIPPGCIHHSWDVMMSSQVKRCQSQSKITDRF